jgi:hypothetical protein
VFPTDEGLWSSLILQDQLGLQLVEHIIIKITCQFNSKLLLFYYINFFCSISLETAYYTSGSETECLCDKAEPHTSLEYKTSPIGYGSPMFYSLAHLASEPLTSLFSDTVC